ncbi:MAG: chloride channel protein [Hyphomicrobiales bacterium]
MTHVRTRELSPRQVARSWWRALSDGTPPAHLGDFTTSPRVMVISAIAIIIGVVATFVAWTLLRLISFFTNVFFFGDFSTKDVRIGDNELGLWILVIPAIGGLIVGLMARYGSEKIRGHGIPEAIEAILIGGSRVEPKVALFKPVSSAISIGSGGPFGAEGPIIMTGGAFGSLVAQFLHLTNAERKTLLVAGAAAGMSATFAAPVAAVLLAVELLLFEWKPRSLVPVALASATAGVSRRYILDDGPLFPTPPHAAQLGVEGLIACVIVGISVGILSLLVTQAVYGAEDAFHKLPIHWMWWPILGGFAIGIGGLIFPEALGVGYDNIRELLQGDQSMRLILGILLVKSTIWAVALGSGTSGGVLAPLLMMGASLGALEAPFLPDQGDGFWAMIGMGAILGGTMRAPLTGVVFAIELTHDINALLPLLVAVIVAHCFTVLTLRRSILTEKISRRGLHLGQEYAVDPLETGLVRAAMRTNLIALPADVPIAELAPTLADRDFSTGQGLYPIVDSNGEMTGAISRNDLRNLTQTVQSNGAGKRTLGELRMGQLVVAYPDETLRVVAQRMAETGRTRLPVVERDKPKQLIGMIALRDLLSARAREYENEMRRERVLRLRVFGPRRRDTGKRETARVTTS